jgi:hypothetical protein
MDITLFIRLAALIGALFILLAALSSAFSMQIARRLKKPFTRLHHPLAATGAALIVLHTILVAYQAGSHRIYLPNFDSWSGFWTLAGCPALILFALSIAAALLMRRIPRIWRRGHWLIYPAMLMAGIHGLRRGQDMVNPLLAAFLGILLVLALLVFIYKRIKKPHSAASSKQPANSQT